MTGPAVRATAGVARVVLEPRLTVYAGDVTEWDAATRAAAGHPDPFVSERPPSRVQASKSGRTVAVRFDQPASSAHAPAPGGQTWPTGAKSPR